MRKILNKRLKENSRKWISRQINDPFVQQTKNQGYRSRSAFKLKELDEKFKIIKTDDFLLDLGSSPGGWSQVAAKKIKKGKILAIDIIQMEKIERVNFILGDFLNFNIQKKVEKFFNKKIDAVISDMASNTTGNKSLDSFRTGELCLNSMEFSRHILKKEGVFLSKFFMGSIHKEIELKAKQVFKKVFVYKPHSSRKESRELYLYCKYPVN